MRSGKSLMSLYPRGHGASQNMRLELAINGIPTNSFWKWNKAINDCRKKANLIFINTLNNQIIDTSMCAKKCGAHTPA